MIFIAYLDSENWVDGIAGFDMKELPEEIKEKKHVILTEEEYYEINMGTEIFWHDGSRITKLRDKRKIWQRLRSQGMYGRRLMERLGEIIHINIPRSAFLPSPENVPIGLPKPFNRVHSPLEFLYEVQPGLMIRPVIKFEELDLLEQGLFDTGVYPDREACWMRAWGWFADPHVQLLTVAWDDEPLMIEVYYFTKKNFINDPYYAGDPEVAFSRFTVHIDKERPHWFWRVCAGPVFKTLKRLGMKKITTTPIRDDRPDWKEILKKYYGAKTWMIAQDGSGESLEYDLDLAISMLEDYPKRKTLGDGWEWQNGNIKLIEADESKLSTAKEDIKAIMRAQNDPRLNTIERDIRAWWELDKASALMAIHDGNLIDLRLFRLKEGQINRVWTIPGSWRLDIDLSKKIARGAALWQKNVGYQKSLVVMPESFFEHPKIKEKNALFGGRFVRKLRDRKEIIEVEYDLDYIIDKTRD